MLVPDLRPSCLDFRGEQLLSPAKGDAFGRDRDSLSGVAWSLLPRLVGASAC